MNILETTRLILREWSEADAPFLYKLNKNTNVIKYTGDTAFKNIKEAEDLVKHYSDYKTFGYGRWICELKDSGEPIGWCGIKNQIETEGIIDIGYRFLEDYWKMGFGTESAKATLDIGFRKFYLHKITGRAAVDNTHSHTILKKIGLKEESEKKDCHGILAKYYSLTLPEYEEMMS